MGLEDQRKNRVDRRQERRGYFPHGSRQERSTLQALDGELLPFSPHMARPNGRRTCAVTRRAFRWPAFPWRSQIVESRAFLAIRPQYRSVLWTTHFEWFIHEYRHFYGRRLLAQMLIAKRAILPTHFFR